MAGWPNSGSCPGFVAQVAKIAKTVQLVLKEHLSFLPTLLCAHFRKGAAFRDSWYVNWTTSSSSFFFFSSSSIVQKKPFGEISPRETTTDTENGESTLRGSERLREPPFSIHVRLLHSYKSVVRPQLSYLFAEFEWRRGPCRASA